MTDPGELRHALAQPFADLPRNAASHFRLWFFAAIVRVIERLSDDAESFEQAFEDFPFLAHYSNQLARYGLDGVPTAQAAARWHDALRAWEDGCSVHLPLRALQRALALEADAMVLLMAAGLPEEDGRFGALFERLNGSAGQRRPTAGLMAAWWVGEADPAASIGRLIDLGLVAVPDRTAPRAEWPLVVPAELWDAMRGNAPNRPAPWARHRAAADLTPLDDLLTDPALQRRAEGIAAAIAADALRTVVVRGPAANGRRTLLGAIAGAGGRGVLALEGGVLADAARWRLAGPLATLLGAMPVLALNPAPGETAVLPDLTGYAGPIGVAIEGCGGLGGRLADPAVHIDLDMPGPDERRAHWQAAFGDRAVPEVGALAHAMRLGSGSIRRAAALALAQARLEGREAVTPDDLRLALRSQQRAALETVAKPLPGGGDWRHLAVPAATRDDLRELEMRCRHRERLGQIGGGAPGSVNAGVRILFKGPSGTGKTLAARLLAHALGKDVYRVDLASVVNKYIGETEKNLERAFARAEELDVVLLLDEGDALMTRRTDVGSANDRYANLETNYLLQRVESFEGILIVTTNAGDRIDGAFARRMDVVVDFPLPQTEERLAIWRIHLPAGHAVDEATLWEVARRCELTGGQIRNAALHAALLALDRGAAAGKADLERAVRREYRKTGGSCPLRSEA